MPSNCSANKTRSDKRQGRLEDDGDVSRGVGEVVIMVAFPKSHINCAFKNRYIENHRREHPTFREHLLQPILSDISETPIESITKRGKTMNQARDTLLNKSSTYKSTSTMPLRVSTTPLASLLQIEVRDVGDTNRARSVRSDSGRTDQPVGFHSKQAY